MLTPTQLEKIQQLSGIRLSDDERGPFLDKLASVITFLDQLQTIDVGDASPLISPLVGHTMSGIEGVPCDPEIDLLANVQHPIIRHHIVVKSAVNKDS